MTYALPRFNEINSYYGPNPDLDRELKKLEPTYKSNSEAQVGRLLDRYGVPFYYEQPTLVYDRGKHRVWRPDFTLPSYNGLVIEYSGMMHVPDYVKGVHHKYYTYQANRIPVLFIYRSDITGRYWPQRLMAKIYQAHERLSRSDWKRGGSINKIYGLLR